MGSSVSVEGMSGGESGVGPFSSSLKCYAHRLSCFLVVVSGLSACLWLKDEIVPQTETPTFLGVKLDTRLTWKPQIEKMERSNLQKIVLMRKLAGTTWGADPSILTKVYTATV